MAEDGAPISAQSRSKVSLPTLADGLRLNLAESFHERGQRSALEPVVVVASLGATQADRTAIERQIALLTVAVPVAWPGRPLDSAFRLAPSQVLGYFLLEYLQDELLDPDSYPILQARPE